MVPLQRRMLDLDLLTPLEVAWVDDYHAEVRDATLPHMTTDEGREWLLGATRRVAEG